MEVGEGVAPDGGDDGDDDDDGDGDFVPPGGGLPVRVGMALEGDRDGEPPEAVGDPLPRFWATLALGARRTLTPRAAPASSTAAQTMRNSARRTERLDRINNLLLAG